MTLVTLVERNVPTRDVPARVVDVAEVLFGELGYRKTTVTDIARELKMSAANIYRFFDSKAAINQAVVRRELADVETLVEQIAGSFGSPSDRLRRSITAISLFHTEQFARRPKINELLVAAFDERWEVVRKHRKAIENSLVQIIVLGMSEGEFATGDAGLVAILVRSACATFCEPRLLTEAEQGAPTVDQMLTFCLAACAKNTTEFAPIIDSA
jgi:AcrR family transcriptional regulator